MGLVYIGWFISIALDYSAFHTARLDSRGIVVDCISLGFLGGLYYFDTRYIPRGGFR